VTIMGHSMGGMLSARFALMFPQNTTRLILVNPIGLEDWKAKGVPWQDPQTTFLSEKASNFSSIKAYEQTTYYSGTWKPEYDDWVTMLELVYNGTQGPRFWWNQALTTDMVLSQPVVYEFPLIKMPTLLLIGLKDNTAIGKAWSPPDVQKVLGNYSVLGKEAHRAIQGSTLVEFDAGHAPQIQIPDQFHEALLEWLESTPETG
jgi:pimeloyl-ACP methyl ester carboxylesterase